MISDNSENEENLKDSLITAWNTVDDIRLLKEEGEEVSQEAIDAIIWLLDSRMSKLLYAIEECCHGGGTTR